MVIVLHRGFIVCVVLTSDSSCTDPMPIYAQLTRGRNLFIGQSVQDESSMDGPAARRSGDAKVVLYLTSCCAALKTRRVLGREHTSILNKAAFNQVSLYSGPRLTSLLLPTLGMIRNLVPVLSLVTAAGTVNPDLNHNFFPNPNLWFTIDVDRF